MKIKTADLKGPALAYAIAKFTPELMQIGNCFYIRDAEGERVLFDPAGNWSQGGPIIEREGIYIACGLPSKTLWNAMVCYPDKSGLHLFRAIGPTPLIAAMRCLVASRLGDEVEVPEELQ